MSRLGIAAALASHCGIDRHSRQATAPAEGAAEELAREEATEESALSRAICRARAVVATAAEAAASAGQLASLCVAQMRTALQVDLRERLAARERKLADELADWEWEAQLREHCAEEDEAARREDAEAEERDARRQAEAIWRPRLWACAATRPRCGTPSPAGRRRTATS